MVVLISFKALEMDQEKNKIDEIEIQYEIPKTNEINQKKLNQIIPNFISKVLNEKFDFSENERNFLLKTEIKIGQNKSNISRENLMKISLGLIILINKEIDLIWGKVKLILTEEKIEEIIKQNQNLYQDLASKMFFESQLEKVKLYDNLKNFYEIEKYFDLIDKDIKIIKNNQDETIFEIEIAQDQIIQRNNLMIEFTIRKIFSEISSINNDYIKLQQNSDNIHNQEFNLIKSLLDIKYKIKTAKSDFEKFFIDYFKIINYEKDEITISKHDVLEEKNIIGTKITLKSTFNYHIKELRKFYESINLTKSFLEKNNNLFENTFKNLNNKPEIKKVFESEMRSSLLNENSNQNTFKRFQKIMEPQEIYRSLFYKIYFIFNEYLQSRNQNQIQNDSYFIVPNGLGVFHNNLLRLYSMYEKNSPISSNAIHDFLKSFIKFCQENESLRNFIEQKKKSSEEGMNSINPNQELDKDDKDDQIDSLEEKNKDLKDQNEQFNTSDPKSELNIKTVHYNAETKEVFI